MNIGHGHGHGHGHGRGHGHRTDMEWYINDGGDYPIGIVIASVFGNDCTIRKARQHSKRYCIIGDDG